MSKVKFVTETKYNGKKYPAHTAFTVDDADMESLRQSGAIVVEITPVAVTPVTEEDTIPDSAPDPLEEEEKAPEEVVDLSKMTVNDLKAFAYKHSINLGGVIKKDIVIEIIKEALAANTIKE